MEQTAEPKRCECGACYVGAGAWWWQGLKYNGPARACIATERNAGHCPECGCRLSVVDGEPRVGEPYADLECDAQRFRAVAANVSEPIENREACPIEWHFETMPTQSFDATLGEYADALGGEPDE